MRNPGKIPAMDQAVSPGCVHHVHVRIDHAGAEPTTVCSCPAGLIHMHDCPMTMGLACVLFEAAEPGEGLPAVGYESLHNELMGQMLTRSYVHRIRNLDPAGDAWSRLREELRERYAAEEIPPDDEGEISEERYEQERERLLAHRRKRDEALKEREEQERKEKEARAQELAERAIRAAEERARREALRPAPEPKKKRRRRRRSKEKSAEPGTPGPPQPKPKPQAEGGATEPRARPRRRRRRRGRRSGGGGADSGGAAS